MRLLAFFFLTAAVACGQSLAGEIRLEVKDATGAGIEATGSIEGLATGVHRDYRSGARGRSFIDLVNQQPGWLLEANGVLHPRGSEYQVQYVVDGIPLYDNRSPAFAQSLGADEFESMTV